MNNIIVLNKDTYEILHDKTLNRHSMYNNKEFNQNLYLSILELIKDLDQISTQYNDFYMLKLDGGKSVVYRKSPDSKLAILIICEKKAIKRTNLIEMSKAYLVNIQKSFLTQANENIVSSALNKKNNFSTLFKTKEFTIQAIEDLTIKFIENLRKNKLYAKFIYYNFNPSVISSMSYKKSKLESTSVILFNSNKDYDKM